MADILYTSAGQVALHDKNDPDAERSFDAIQLSFPWFDRDAHRGALDRYRHEAVGEEVICACVMISHAEDLLQERVGTAHRLFGMESLTSVLYVTKLYQGPPPAWADPEMVVLGVTEHHEEMMRPCRPDMLTFAEFFFVAPPAVLQGLGLDLTGVNHDTVFSALVRDGQVVCYRRYTNFVEGDTGVLANWQTLYTLHCKLARRMDLVRGLFSLQFVADMDQ